MMTDLTNNAHDRLPCPIRLICRAAREAIFGARFLALGDVFAANLRPQMRMRQSNKTIFAKMCNTLYQSATKAEAKKKRGWRVED